MDTDDIYISVSLEPDGDEPVADLIYRGKQWVSLTHAEGELVLTVYSDPDGDGAGSRLPLAAVLPSLQESRTRLEAFG